MERRRKGREGKVEGLHAKFHVNVFIVSASGGQKTTIVGKSNFDFLGAPVPTPYIDKCQI